MMILLKDDMMILLDDDNSTFSEKDDQECPGHDFLMSRYAVRYVSSKSEA